MAHEIEAAALDSAKAVTARTPKHTLPSGAPCPNCGTTLIGPWCAACGQSSEEFHRSLVRLAGEALGGLFDYDSRLRRTVPDLCLRPGRLTRAYLDGHRTPQVPPFRLFLVVIVLVFFVAGLGPREPSVWRVGDLHTAPLGTSGAPPADLARAARDPEARWLITRLAAVSKNPERFQASLFAWAQRVAVLFLPVSAALLGLMFVGRRGVYLFDHLIFSMHSLSFQGLLLSLTMLATVLNEGFGWLLALAPVHLFVHLRGTYGLGVVGTLVRMLVLFCGSALALLAAMVGVTMIGLYEVGA